MLIPTINNAVIFAISVVIIGNNRGFGHVSGLDNDIKNGVTNGDDEVSTCHGKYNIPIVDTTYKIVQKDFPKINMSGFDKPANSAEVINNGHKVYLNLSYDIPPTLEGGPMPKKKGIYTFAHVDFHWRGNETSDYYYDNEADTAELHLVFYNKKYFSVKEALNNDDGIVVMAFSFWVESKENMNYIELIEVLSQVGAPNTRAAFINPPKLGDLIVKHNLFFNTYKGSLTTPPCSRDVIWLDFDETILISMKQYIALEQYFKQQIIQQNPKLKATIYEQLSANYVPTERGQGIPFIYSTSKANSHLKIPNGAWIILITFRILQYVTY